MEDGRGNTENPHEDMNRDEGDWITPQLLLNSERLFCADCGYIFSNGPFQCGDSGIPRMSLGLYFPTIILLRVGKSSMNPDGLSVPNT